MPLQPYTFDKNAHNAGYLWRFLTNETPWLNPAHLAAMKQYLCGQVPDAEHGHAENAFLGYARYTYSEQIKEHFFWNSALSQSNQDLCSGPLYMRGLTQPWSAEIDAQAFMRNWSRQYELRSGENSPAGAVMLLDSVSYLSSTQSIVLPEGSLAVLYKACSEQIDLSSMAQYHGDATLAVAAALGAAALACGEKWRQDWAKKSALLQNSSSPPYALMDSILTGPYPSAWKNEFLKNVAAEHLLGYPNRVLLRSCFPSDEATRMGQLPWLDHAPEQNQRLLGRCCPTLNDVITAFASPEDWGSANWLRSLQTMFVSPEPGPLEPLQTPSPAMTR